MITIQELRQELRQELKEMELEEQLELELNNMDLWFSAVQSFGYEANTEVE